MLFATLLSRIRGFLGQQCEHALLDPGGTVLSYHTRLIDVGRKTNLNRVCTVLVKKGSPAAGSGCLVDNGHIDGANPLQRRRGHIPILLGPANWLTPGGNRSSRFLVWLARHERWRSCRRDPRTLPKERWLLCARQRGPMPPPHCQEWSLGPYERAQSDEACVDLDHRSRSDGSCTSARPVLVCAMSGPVVVRRNDPHEEPQAHHAITLPPGHLSLLPVGLAVLKHNTPEAGARKMVDGQRQVFLYDPLDELATCRDCLLCVDIK